MGKLDILSREEFVEQLITLTENISENKSTTSFAINGAWGCGKSFVLDMFEEKLGQYQSEETATDKYFIIRYNCWKYDYYEEPLIAIVAAIIDNIEEKIRLFPDSQDKQEIFGMLVSTGAALLTVFDDAIKSKLGFGFSEVKEAITTVKDGAKKGKAKYEKEHGYDGYLGFKKVLGKLQKLLGELSQRFTLVFLVDELDRCLPEYAIKVLERLHHLSSGIANNITIISMDKSQLTTSIQRIFGFANPEKYLEKFIDFELKLNYGTVSEKITEKYADYIALFDKDIFQFNDSIEEFLQILFTDLDIRKQEQLVNRAKLVHTLLYSDAKDYSFMCMELLLAVLICIYDETSIFSVNPVYLSDYDQIFCPISAKTQPTFSKFIAKKLKSLNFSHVQSIVENTDIYILPSPTSLYAALLFTWSWLHENRRGVVFQLRPNDAYANIANNHKDLKKFAEVIRMLK